jgi:sec-independent protein translocase protein TatB
MSRDAGGRGRTPPKAPLAGAPRRCYRLVVFGVGPTEMLVIAAVALMMFSPRELPRILRSVAKFWAQLRATADDFRDQIMHADGVDELTEMVKGTKAELRRAEDQARQELMKARMKMRKAQQKLAATNRAKAERQREHKAVPAPKESGPSSGATAEATAAEATPVATPASARTPEVAPLPKPPATPQSPAPAVAEAAQRRRVSAAEASRLAARSEAARPSTEDPPTQGKGGADMNQGAA